MKSYRLFFIGFLCFVTTPVFGTWYEKLFAAWCVACSTSNAFEMPHSGTVAVHKADTNTTVCVVDLFEKMRFPKQKRLEGCLQSRQQVSNDSWFQEHGIVTDLARQLPGYKATGAQVWRIVYNVVGLEKRGNDPYLISSASPTTIQVPPFLEDNICAAYKALRACQVVSTNKMRAMKRRGKVKRIGEKTEKMG